MMRRVICRLDEIADPGSKAFSLPVEEGGVDLFVVRAGEQLVAYRNACPHTGGPLDWVPDQFLNIDGDLIQCATHDALFRIGDGVCVRGPCAGQSLTPLDVAVIDGQVMLDIGGSGSQ